jgi:fucose 4-O-acetylase-like acetyltransferase
MKERDKGIDILKGFLISCVVIGHAIATYMGEKCYTNWIFMICYSFHMYLFFFVSGFLAYGKNRLTKQWVIKRAERLLLPFFIWNSFKYFTGAFDLSILSYLEVLMTSRWFLLTLFIVEIIVSIIQTFIKTKKIQNAAVFTVFVIMYLASITIGEDVHTLRLIAIYLPFYYVGNIRISMNFKLKQSMKIVLCTLYPISMFFYSIENHDRVLSMLRWVLEKANFSSSVSLKIYMFIEKIGMPLYNHFIVASLGCYFWWTIVRYISRISKMDSILKIFGIAGRYTLQIYIMSNYFFVFSFANDTINIIFGSIFSLFSTCIISFAMKKYLPVVSKILFGS